MLASWNTSTIASWVKLVKKKTFFYFFLPKWGEITQGIEAVMEYLPEVAVARRFSVEPQQQKSNARVNQNHPVCFASKCT